MNLRQRKRLIYLVGVMAGLLGIAVMLVGVWRAPQIEINRVGDGQATDGQVVGNDLTLDSLSSQLAWMDLARVSAIDLRHPLYDPPPPPPPPPAKVALPVTLMGTFEEGDHSMAVFQLASGATEIRHSGEQFDTPAGTIKVIQVQRTTATVEFRGQTYELTTPEEAASAVRDMPPVRGGG
jgi:hypothetical protein